MNRISNALNFIPADERSTWVSMAMAVKSELGDAGFNIWDDWSQSASNYNALAARSVWKSCKGTGITAASLFHEAKLNGFKDDQRYTPPTRDQIESQQRAAAERASKEGQDRHRLAQLAAKKAEWIMDQCKAEKHAYLDSKGFKDADGPVWRPDAETNLLCIPVYVGRELSSVQMIDKTGVKKFLSNGITAGGEFCMDSGAINATDWWVEGYASGLSLRACLGAIKQPARIHICFSAQNMKRLAHSGFIVADHDESRTGQEAASATGLPYWLPEVVGTDINDVHRQLGTFKASQVLRKWLQEIKENEAFYDD